MSKLTIDDLKKIRDQKKATFNIREGDNRAKITVHMGTCGIAAGAREVLSAVNEELAALKIEDVIITTSGCAGLCSKEPMATVEVKGQAPVKYVFLDVAKARKIVQEHVAKGEVVEEYALAIGSENAY